jgi:hypothetical protein
LLTPKEILGGGVFADESSFGFEAAAAASTPNLNPLDGAGAAPNENDAVGAGEAPKDTAGAAAAAVDAAGEIPKENDDVAGAAGEAAAEGAASPGGSLAFRGTSQALHFLSSFGLLAVQLSHFQLPAAGNMLAPQPITVDDFAASLSSPVLVFFFAISAAFASSSSVEKIIVGFFSSLIGTRLNVPGARFLFLLLPLGSFLYGISAVDSPSVTLA